MTTIIIESLRPLLKSKLQSIYTLFQLYIFKLIKKSELPSIYLSESFSLILFFNFHFVAFAAA
jgi:hypothetical protein